MGKHSLTYLRDCRYSLEADGPEGLYEFGAGTVFLEGLGLAKKTKNFKSNFDWADLRVLKIRFDVQSTGVSMVIVSG